MLHLANRLHTGDVTLSQRLVSCLAMFDRKRLDHIVKFRVNLELPNKKDYVLIEKTICS